jgi:hypothetical protein
VLYSKVWQHFDVIVLHKPQRDKDALIHSQFVDRVGRDECARIPHPLHTSLIALENFEVTTDVQKAIQHTFPLDDPTTLQDPLRAIITTHNDSVDQLNAQVLEQLPEPLVTLRSEDKLEEELSWKNKHNFLHTDFLNAVRINPASQPPHELHLKVGAMVMIMRNISRKHRLMNGTRVKVVEILDYTIVVETLDTKQVHTIFRFLFRIRLRNIGVTIIRRQFPLRVAYAMTVHKCQGMTLTHVTLDVRRQPFSHGILYVACGRVKNAKSLQVLVADTSYIHENQALATNIVWHDLLPSSWRPTHTAPQLPPMVRMLTRQEALDLLPPNAVADSVNGKDHSYASEI